jgi:F0F1-type ATP synthase membrane subunit c/vacuolar-type H+-ATPase subunit K
MISLAESMSGAVARVAEERTLGTVWCDLARRSPPGRLHAVLHVAGPLGLQLADGQLWPVALALLAATGFAGWGIADRSLCATGADSTARFAAVRRLALRTVRGGAALLTALAVLALIFAVTLWLSGPAPTL